MVVIVAVVSIKLFIKFSCDVWQNRILKWKAVYKCTADFPAINICREDANEINVAVEGTRLMQLEKLLRNRNICYQVTNTNADLSGSHRVPSPVYGSPREKSPTRRSMNWTEYQPLNVIYAYLQELEEKYPSTCSISVIGSSVEGRDIVMLKISNSNASNTGVWLDGTTHAREWISACVVTYIGEQIATRFDTMPTNITNKDWYLVPVVNPDGYVYSHTNDRLWRKNRARVGNATFGVDLNRNFSLKWGWGTNGAEYSSNDPKDQNFRGSEAFSEPEVAAIKDILLCASVPFKIFLTFHAYSETITFPWCFTSDPCPDYVNLLEGGTIMAKAMFDTHGHMYKVGNFNDLMYPASGTSIDWSYGVARIPFSYLIELRSKEYKFLLPNEHILKCCTEVWNGVMALTEHVDTKKCLNCLTFKPIKKNPE